MTIVEFQVLHQLYTLAHRYRKIDIRPSKIDIRTSPFIIVLKQAKPKSVSRFGLAHA